MSKQYTLASERADAPTGCAYVAPTFWNKWFRWVEAPGIRLLPAGPGRSRTKTTPACRFFQMANGTRSLDGHWTTAAPQLTIRR